MTTVHLVHGFNVTDRGRRTTDKLAPWFHLVGFETRQHDYPWRFLIATRLGNPKMAEQVARAVKPGDIGCGHSNGCTILAAAADLGAPFEGLVLINPALDCRREIAEQVEWIHVYHNRGDVPVQMAHALRIFPWNWSGQPWGDMGNCGYTGANRRYRNFDGAAGDPEVLGHSAIFAQLDTWGQVIGGNTYAAKAWARSERASRAVAA